MGNDLAKLIVVFHSPALALHFHEQFLGSFHGFQITGHLIYCKHNISSIVNKWSFLK